jgi:hypothetical protein
MLPVNPGGIWQKPLSSCCRMTLSQGVRPLLRSKKEGMVYAASSGERQPPLAMVAWTNTRPGRRSL